jgi:hypothetical protein
VVDQAQHVTLDDLEDGVGRGLQPTGEGERLSEADAIAAVYARLGFLELEVRPAASAPLVGVLVLGRGERLEHATGRVIGAGADRLVHVLVGEVVEAGRRDPVEHDEREDLTRVGWPSS